MVFFSFSINLLVWFWSRFVARINGMADVRSKAKILLLKFAAAIHFSTCHMYTIVYMVLHGTPLKIICICFVLVIYIKLKFVLIFTIIFYNCPSFCLFICVCVPDRLLKPCNTVGPNFRCVNKSYEGHYQQSKCFECHLQIICKIFKSNLSAT